MAGPRTFRRFKPAYLHCVRYYWAGKSTAEIAALTGYSEAWVSTVLASTDAAEILKRLTDHTLDTMVQVQDAYQAAAPQLVEEQIRLATDSATPANVKATLIRDALGIAGHSATHRIEIDKSGAGQFAEMSEAEIEAELLRTVEGTSPADLGPDGKLVN